MNTTTNNTTFSYWFPYLLLAAIVLNATGLGTSLLDGDSALYATTAKYMITRHDWVNLYAYGSDWLDKPHFPFWVAAVFYKLFGISAFAYKFSSFVFWLLGLRFTYLLAKALYNPLVAQMAVLMQALALHGILSNFDVRAEPVLTALCTGAIYFFFQSYRTGRWRYILLTAVLSGCAVMTKGIFSLLTIGGGFVVYWIVTKQWKQFVNYKWYILVALIGICTLPEIYCLYVQFDQHPEKVVFGKTGVSGIRFFLWDSQFGRFFNTGPIKGKGDPSFFLHTTLWAFLPWAIYLYIAVVRLFGKRDKVATPAQWVIFGSAGLTFLLFSLSSFQLPHYVVILFPQFAIMTAGYLASLQSRVTWKRLITTQNVLLFVATALVIGLMLFSKIGYSAWVFLIAATVLVLAFALRIKDTITSFFIKSIAFATTLFLYLNLFFYPQLMQYQSGMMAGKWLRKNGDTRPAGMLDQFDFTLEFYAPGPVYFLHSAQDTFLQSGRLVYTKKILLPDLQAAGHPTKVLQSFPYFHITKLKGKFINPVTRPQLLDTVVLAEVQ